MSSSTLVVSPSGVFRDYEKGSEQRFWGVWCPRWTQYIPKTLSLSFACPVVRHYSFSDVIDFILDQRYAGWRGRDLVGSTLYFTQWVEHVNYIQSFVPWWVRAPLGSGLKDCAFWSCLAPVLFSFSFLVPQPCDIPTLSHSTTVSAVSRTDMRAICCVQQG